MIYIFLGFILSTIYIVMTMLVYGPDTVMHDHDLLTIYQWIIAGGFAAALLDYLILCLRFRLCRYLRKSADDAWCKHAQSCL